MSKLHVSTVDILSFIFFAINWTVWFPIRHLGLMRFWSLSLKTHQTMLWHQKAQLYSLCWSGRIELCIFTALTCFSLETNIKITWNYKFIIKCSTRLLGLPIGLKTIMSQLSYYFFVLLCLVLAWTAGKYWEYTCHKCCKYLVYWLLLVLVLRTFL